MGLRALPVGDTWPGFMPCIMFVHLCAILIEKLLLYCIVLIEILGIVSERSGQITKKIIPTSGASS